jgi:H/ACA ribonucleoprotein complex subunit 4
MNIEEIKQKKSVKELLEFGIINIDKSSGPTSFNISDFVRKSLGLRKTSHFGTLDPKVTGVLPIGINRACKLTGYFLGEDKEYVGIMRLHDDVPLEKIEEKIKEKFLGEIMQMPPVKSRVKRQIRPRTIYSFDLLEKGGTDVLFKVKCQGGTYIRKLLDDLGQELGVGAHMLELRRISAGIFDESFSVDLYEFEKAVEEYKKGNEGMLKDIIIPGEIIQRIHSPIEIRKDNLTQIFTGKPIYKKDLIKDTGVKKDATICVFCEGSFVGMYTVVRGKEIFAKSEFVMQPVRN